MKMFRYIESNIGINCHIVYTYAITVMNGKALLFDCTESGIYNAPVAVGAKAIKWYLALKNEAEKIYDVKEDEVY